MGSMWITRGTERLLRFSSQPHHFERAEVEGEFPAPSLRAVLVRSQHKTNTFLHIPSVSVLTDEDNSMNLPFNAIDVVPEPMICV